MNPFSLTPVAAPALSILIVEDAEYLAELLRRYTESCGHHGTTVYNLAEARQALQSGRYQVCLVDLDLPDGDGRSLLSDLGPQASFISLSGMEQPAVDAHWPAWIAHLPKPFSPEEFHEVLDLAADRARVRPVGAPRAGSAVPAPSVKLAYPEIVGVVLRESVRLYDAGEITLEHFEANVARLQKEELERHDLHLSTEHLQPGFRFILTRDGQEIGRIEGTHPSPEDGSPQTSELPE